MNWFKHKSDTHQDYKITDAFKKYGHLAYKFYFILHEIYAKYYNEQDRNEYVKISKEKLGKINNINPRNIEKLLKYFREKGKIRYAIDGEIILFKINDFKKLHSSWYDDEKKRKRKKDTIEVEVEEEVEKEVDNILINYEEEAITILDYLNFKTQKNYKDKRYIIPLLKKGYKVEDFIKVIRNKTEDEFFKKNKKILIPKVIFKEEMFDVYLNEKEIGKEDSNEKKE